MIMETVIHAEIQSEDETTINDRTTADHVRGCHVRGCRIAHGRMDVHTLAAAEKQ